MIKDPNYGVKCLVAFLSLENVMTKGRLRKREYIAGFQCVKTSANQKEEAMTEENLSRKLKFYQMRCLDLELENSKLKADLKTKNPSVSKSRSKSPNFKRKHSTDNKSQSKKALRRQRSSSPNPYTNFGRGRSKKDSFQDQENQMWRANVQGNDQRAKSTQKGGKTIKIVKQPSISGPGNTKILPISKTMFKKILA